MSKLDKMFEVISANHFKELFDLSDDLKCVFCHKMLNNAHQLICGCRFCKKCVYDLLKTEVQFCPGLSFNCGNEMLSNQTVVQVDHRANKEISILIVNCPKQTCTHKCELIFMANHLEICVTGFQRCPFHEFGCEEVSEKMNDHLQLMSANHNQMLIENISILRNEITFLKNSITTNLEIGLLNDNLSMKDRQITLINDQMELLKMKIENQIRELDNEKYELRKEIEERKKLSEDLLLVKCLIGTCKTEIPNQNNKTLNLNNIDPTFAWIVDNIFPKKLAASRIWSETFYSKKHGYTMRLLLYPNGYRSSVGKLSLYLYVYANQLVKWPFEAEVTIQISNKSNANHFKTKTSHCNMNKPVFFNWFPPFEYEYDQWQTENNLNNIIIKCEINEK